MSTKIHALVDALGNPVEVSLTPGQTHDITEAGKLLEGKVASIYFAADKAYDCDAFIAQIEATGAQVVIPPRRNRQNQRDYDRDLYRERHLVEIFFNRMKQYRRVATRYEKTATNYLAMVLIACIRVWLA